jgi:hypothetical protein
MAQFNPALKPGGSRRMLSGTYLSPEKTGMAKRYLLATAMY